MKDGKRAVERMSVLAKRSSLVALCALAASCGGGGSSGSSAPAPTPTPTPAPTPTPTGDEARREVLAALGNDVIVPALTEFTAASAALETAATAYAAAPGDAAARTATRAAWEAAMASWQRSEVLQLGPAGRSQNPDAVLGGQDFRNFIYSWPVTLDVCGLEAAADGGATVDANTPIDITGLGAIEHLLYTDAPPAECAAQPDASARAGHVERLAARIAVNGASLENRWLADGGNFITQWSTAGLSSSVTYGTPQDALDALSIAIFYAEKSTKDRKTAFTTGVGATGLTCSNPASCPEFLESRLSRRSGNNILVNLRTFRDVLTGVDGGLGLNDLLIGIDRDDLASRIVEELDVAIARIGAIEDDSGFDAAVESIADRTECVNAFSSSSGLAACALLGEMKTALDTYRVDVVAALSLAIPDAAAGDND